MATNYNGASVAANVAAAPIDENSNNSAVTAFEKAFDRAVQAIAKDLPLIMHGSGDVLPHQVSPEATHLLSALTVQYLGRLVSEALSAHEMLMDGDKYNIVSSNNKNYNSNNSSNSNNVKVFPPPPVFVKSRLPTVPLPPERLKKRKNITSKDEFWDEPMKAPKIVDNRNNNNVSSIIEGARSSNKVNPNVASLDSDVHIDEWVGLAGVDFLENRTRKAFVRGTTGLTTQSFVFPICHDVYAYGRVTQIQQSGRLLEPFLVDPVVKEMAQAEGKCKERRSLSRKKKKPDNTGGDNDNASDPEDEDDGDDVKSDQHEDEGGMPVWPGLESLLPIYKGFE